MSTDPSTHPSQRATLVGLLDSLSLSSIEYSAEICLASGRLLKRHLCFGTVGVDG